MCICFSVLDAPIFSPFFFVSTHSHCTCLIPVAVALFFRYCLNVHDWCTQHDVLFQSHRNVFFFDSTSNEFFFVFVFYIPGGCCCSEFFFSLLGLLFFVRSLSMVFFFLLLSLSRRSIQWILKKKKKNRILNKIDT